MEIFDSHLHLADDLLFPEWEAILNRALHQGIKKLLVITTNPLEMTRALKMKELYPEHLYVAASTTPHEAHLVSESDILEIEAAAKEGLLDALGETGLEYHYLKETKETQIALLKRTLTLASELKLPVVFHCREAFDDLFPILEEFRPNGVLHCFTGTKEEASKVIEHGLFLSLSGIITYPKSTLLRDAIKDLPLESLLIETDAPFLAPQSKRGKQNEPLFILETLQILADTLKLSPQELALQTYKNALAFLTISAKRLECE